MKAVLYFQTVCLKDLLGFNESLFLRKISAASSVGRVMLCQDL